MDWVIWFHHFTNTDIFFLSLQGWAIGICQGPHEGSLQLGGSGVLPYYHLHDFTILLNTSFSINSYPCGFAFVFGSDLELKLPDLLRVTQLRSVSLSKMENGLPPCHCSPRLSSYSVCCFLGMQWRLFHRCGRQRLPTEPIILTLTR